MKEVSLRKFPYPFKAALTVCSDIDRTRTVEQFLAIQNFLNSDRTTELGPGLGLEIGNSFFPLTSDDSFSYLSSRSRDRAVIRELIKAGYIDCIHSYGNGARSRCDVLRTLDILEKDGCKLKVWIDHSKVPTNFGKDKTFGLGDVVGSPVYHADVTLDYGIKYAWMGRGTSIIGQETSIRPRAICHMFDAAHPRASVKKIINELGKIILAKSGNSRFAIHSNNKLLRKAKLHNGHPIYEFNRCNNHWSKRTPGSEELSYVLRPNALRVLKDAQGYMLIYTHLGRVNTPSYIPVSTRSSLRNLADEYYSGEIYVTTTVRLLDYCVVHRYLKWSCNGASNGQLEIRIDKINDPMFGTRKPTLEELQGITFYVPDNRKTTVFLGDKIIDGIQRNPKDHTSRESVMIPRTYLKYPV